MYRVCNKVHERIILIVKYPSYNKKKNNTKVIWCLGLHDALQNHIYYSNANKAKDQAPVPSDSYGTLRTDSMLS